METNLTSLKSKCSIMLFFLNRFCWCASLYFLFIAQFSNSFAFGGTICLTALTFIYRERYLSFLVIFIIFPKLCYFKTLVFIFYLFPLNVIFLIFLIFFKLILMGNYFKLVMKILEKLCYCLIIEYHLIIKGDSDVFLKQIFF